MVNKYVELLHKFNIHEKLNDDEIIPRLEHFIDSKITMIRPGIYRFEKSNAVLTVNFIKRECKDEIKPTNESYGKSWIFNFKGDKILEFTTAPILNF